MVLFLDLLHVFLVLNLQLMEVYELELVAHLLLLCDLVGRFDYLSGKCGLFVLVFFD